MADETREIQLAEFTEAAIKAASGNDLQLKNSGLKKLLSGGPEEQSEMLKEALRRIVTLHEPRIADLNYPASVRTLIEKEFARIKTELDSDAALDLKDHPTRCDFRIANFSRIPVGVQHMELGGVPRRMFYSGGFGQAVKYLRMVLSARGVKPFYRLHLSKDVGGPAFLLQYSRSTQQQMYRNIAESLMLNPQIKGVFVGSWWYDPQLEQVSPYLAYLKEFPTENGAYLFRYGITKGATKFALANSPDRQELYNQGRYQPAAYNLVWPRSSLIAWAKRTAT